MKKFKSLFLIGINQKELILLSVEKDKARVYMGWRDRGVLYRGADRSCAYL